MAVTIPRLEGEPEKYHAVLLSYAAAGPARPGVRAFVEARPPGGPSWRACYRAATEWHWRERLADHDRAQAGAQFQPTAPVPLPAQQAGDQPTDPGQPASDAAIESALRQIAMDAGQRGPARVQAAIQALALAGRVAPRRPSREELREEQRAAERARDERANTLAGHLGPDDSMILLLRLQHPELRLALVTSDGGPVDLDAL